MEEQEVRCANCGEPLIAKQSEDGTWHFYTSNSGQEVTYCLNCFVELDYEDTLPGHSDEKEE